MGKKIKNEIAEESIYPIAEYLGYEPQVNKGYGRGPPI